MSTLYSNVQFVRKLQKLCLKLYEKNNDIVYLHTNEPDNYLINGDYSSDHVNSLMWYALSDKSCYQIVRNLINTPSFFLNVTFK